jgi:hypothetical protein
MKHLLLGAVLLVTGCMKVVREDQLPIAEKRATPTQASQEQDEPASSSKGMTLAELSAAAQAHRDSDDSAGSNGSTGSDYSDDPENNEDSEYTAELERKERDRRKLEESACTEFFNQAKLFSSNKTLPPESDGVKRCEKVPIAVFRCVRAATTKEQYAPCVRKASAAECRKLADKLTNYYGAEAFPPEKAATLLEQCTTNGVPASMIDCAEHSTKPDWDCMRSFVSPRTDP